MIYATSDLHGYPHERFLKMLDKVRFSEEDFLFVLGDVIDRNGDGGLETLQWLKYNHYLNRQIDLILETDWTTAFSTHPASFGKVDAAFMIRKSLGSMRSIA